MKSNIKTALDKWINGSGPDSYHPLDMNRFYEVVLQCIKEDEVLTQEQIAASVKENLKWVDIKTNEFSEEFAIIAENIISFVDFLKNEKDIDINSKY